MIKMNEEQIKVIYVWSNNKEESKLVLKQFVNAFPNFIDKYFYDTVLLKNGITITAIDSSYTLNNKKHFRWYSAECFMENCYKKAYENVQNNWNNVKELLQKNIKACDGYVKCCKGELIQKGTRSIGKTYLQGKIRKNKIASLTFSLILADMKQRESNNE